MPYDWLEKLNIAGIVFYIAESIWLFGFNAWPIHDWLIRHLP